MRRDVKYIIIKIIIGVGILYFSKLLAFIPVSAKGMLTPNDFTIFDSSHESGFSPGLQIFSEDSFRYYGRAFGNDNITRSRLLWTFNSDLDLTKSYDFNFTGYFGVTTNSSFNVRGYIQDSTGFINSCEVDSSIWSRTSTASSSQTHLSPDAVITCKNVQLNSKDFNFTLLNVLNAPNEFIGISSLSYKENDSNKIESAIKEQTEETKKTNDAINSSDTSESESEASGFFNDFESNSHGLSGIISSPLRLIESLASEECSPLTFPLPFVDENVSLNCMSSIYSTYFGSFFTLYQLITTGLISYWILIRLFSKVKDFQNPNSDKVEVFDL